MKSALIYLPGGLGRRSLLYCNLVQAHMKITSIQRLDA